MFVGVNPKMGLRSHLNQDTLLINITKEQVATNKKKAIYICLLLRLNSKLFASSFLKL
jgi:hypothetical protein